MPGTGLVFPMVRSPAERENGVVSPENQSAPAAQLCGRLPRSGARELECSVVLLPAVRVRVAHPLILLGVLRLSPRRNLGAWLWLGGGNSGGGIGKAKSRCTDETAEEQIRESSLARALAGRLNYSRLVHWWMCVAVSCSICG